MNLLQIGKTIKRLRIERVKLSQEDFSSAAGIERTFLSKIESGKQNITFGTLSAICDGLRMSLSEFFEECEKNKE